MRNSAKNAHNRILAGGGAFIQLSAVWGRALPKTALPSPRGVAVAALMRRKAFERYLMRKLSLVSLVPFISSRIQTGVMPLPVHFNDIFFLL